MAALQPTVVILNVWRDVRAFENALKACNMMSFRDLILKSIVDAVVDTDMCYARLLEVVAELKHSQGPHLSERNLQKLAMAAGDLGMAMINDIQAASMYDGGVILPYEYGGIEQSTVWMKHLFKKDSTLMRSF